MQKVKGYFSLDKKFRNHVTQKSKLEIHESTIYP